MKNLKRILSLVLVSVMILSLSACIHKKNEIAVKIGDEKFTSAYYMCSLIYAYTEAKQKVQESDDLTEDEQNGNAEIDYFSKKIDKKDFETWVEDRAIEVIKTNAAYRILCKENKLELTEEQKNQIENGVYQNWDYYGASEYFSPKGVSRDTYKTYLTDSYYSELYFYLSSVIVVFVTHSAYINIFIASAVNVRSVRCISVTYIRCSSTLPSGMCFSLFFTRVVSVIAVICTVLIIRKFL